MSEFRRRMMMAAGEKELPNYLCFTALEDGTFTLNIGSYMSTTELSYVEYSVDNGSTWVKTNNINNTNIVITTPTIQSGSSVLWKGVGAKMGKDSLDNRFSYFRSTGRFDISGCIVSLIYGESFDENTRLNDNYNFIKLFNNCTTLVSAENLILPLNVRNHCYNTMFGGCTSLTKAPYLRATEVTGASFYYSNMFAYCTSLTTFQDSFVYNSGARLQSMFVGCSSLEKAVELPVENVGGYDYMNIFYGTKVKYIKMLGVTLGSNALLNWVYGVPNTSDCIFVKHIDATWTTTGNNGVPSNWTIIYYDPAVNKYYTDQTRATECDDHGNPI